MYLLASTWALNFLLASTAAKNELREVYDPSPLLIRLQIS
jgi:hypothetical protein